MAQSVFVPDSLIVSLSPVFYYECSSFLVNYYNYIDLFEAAHSRRLGIYIQYSLRLLHFFEQGKGFDDLITFCPCSLCSFPFLTDALKRAVLAGASVVLFVIPTEFIISSNPLIVPHLIIVAFVILTPIINHFRMLIAIRQQSHQVADAVASNQQRNMILRREKKVAFDMFIVAIVLLISFIPPHLVKILQRSGLLKSVYRYLFPWALSATFMRSYMNPIIYFWRNKELRRAMKSTLSC